MKFLVGWQIVFDKIPNYKELKNPMTEIINEELFRLCLNELNEEDRKIAEGYLVGVKNNQRITYYNNRFDCGRFYPNTIMGNHTGLLPLKRRLKNTIYKYLKWVDVDQVRGHVTILLELAERNGIVLKYYKKYIENFDEIMNTLSEFYSVENEKPFTKKEIKLLFNLTIYGGGFRTWKTQMIEKDFKIDNENVEHSFYKKFKKETTTIIDIVYNKNPEIINKVCIDEQESEYEKKNKVMSYFCGTIENEITYQALMFLKKRKHVNKILSWALDGITFPSCEFDIDELNKFVREKTAFNTVRFIVKDFEGAYDNILDEFIKKEEEKKNDELKLHEEIKEEFKNMCIEFEKTHFKVLENAVYVKEENDKCIVYNETTFKQVYRHMSYRTIGAFGIVKNSFIENWISGNDGIRKYEKFKFCPPPMICPENYFNLWKPYKYSKEEHYNDNKEDVDFIVDHFKLMCDNDENVYNYVFKWISHLLNNPAEKSTCLIFTGEQGCGKSTIALFLEKIIGSEKYISVTNPSRDIWGTFNELLMPPTMLVNLNELCKKDTVNSIEQIKGLITESMTTISGKNKPQLLLELFHRFIITTNHQEPIKIEDGDRRMLLINSSSAKIGDAKYFNKIYKLIKNEDVIKSLYKYFSNINCDGFKNEPLPKTEYSEDIKKSNKHPIVLYLEDYVLENWVNDKTIVKDKSINTKEILLKNIFKNFNDWKSKSNITFEISNIKFALFLKKINVDGIKLLGHTNQGNKYEFDLDKMKTYFKIGEIQMEKDEIGKVDELDNP